VTDRIGLSTTTDVSTRPYCRVLIAGHARCGKDTVAAMLASASGGVLRCGLSTSEFYCKLSYGDDWERQLAEFKATPDGREKLAHLMAFYNSCSKNTPSYPGAQLYGEMVASGIDTIVGIRRMAEVQACCKAGLLTHAVWVDRAVPPDATLDYDYAGLLKCGLRTILLDNRDDVACLEHRVRRCWRSISMPARPAILVLNPPR
jgi:hypothetical protein